MRTGTLWVLILMLLGLSGCMYEEFRQRKADADVREETAEFLKQYRLCLQRYENDPAKSREHCSAYGDVLHQINPKRPERP